MTLSQSLRAGLADGRPAAVILDHWPALEASARHDGAELGAALDEAARLDAGAGSAALTPASAVGAAILGPSGQMICADPAFEAWFDRPLDCLDFRRLLRAAHKAGRASGLVVARDGAAVATCVGGRAVAAGWPLSDLCRAALEGGPGRLALLAFAPSRASDLAVRAAEAFGLTPLEARLAEALLDAPTLLAAAERIGVGRETARDALRGAMKKTGARRSPDLVRRMMDLMCGDQPPSQDLRTVLQTAFAATPAEARAAARFAEGLTAREVAAVLGVKEATIRGQLKAVFLKTGVNKAKDLVRLAAETGALATLTGMSETVLESVGHAGRLRVVPAPHERRVAFIDYGPRSGRPLIVLHGSSTGRSLPARFAALLQAKGRRPIVPQRPGFALTDRAQGDYLAQAADDLDLLLGELRLGEVDILARDVSVAAALAFAERYPKRVRRGVLVNPHAPYEVERNFITLQAAVVRTFMARPELIEAFAEMLRRQTRTDILRATIGKSLTAEADRRAIEDPRVLDHLVRDAQAQAARTSAGFAAEHALYARGWRPPSLVGGARWTILHSEPLNTAERTQPWAHLPRAQFRTHADAGFLIYFTHPEAVAELLD